MKTLMIVLTLLFLTVNHAGSVVDYEDKMEVEEEKSSYQKCPKLGYTEDCFKCHVPPYNKLKEPNPHDIYEYPSVDFKFIFDKNDNPIKGHLLITQINSYEVDRTIKYMNRYGIKHLIIEMHSPGGSLFAGHRIKGILGNFKKHGGVVETHVYGFAASAAFFIMQCGTIGHRKVSPTAQIMWHELMSFSLFKLETPSSSEEESRVLRHLQDTANEWLATRSDKITKEELDKRIHKKEYWMNGKQCLEMGFADKFLE